VHRSLAIAAALCIAATAGAQDRSRPYLDVQAGTMRIAVGARPTGGVEIVLRDADSTVRVAPSPFAALGWADTADAMIRRSVDGAAGHDVELRTPDLNGGAGRLGLRRTVRSDSTILFLFAAGPYDMPFIGSTVSRAVVDSLLGALRIAANEYVAAQGDRCRAKIDSTVAAKGAPTDRTRGARADGSLYEKLTFPGRLSEPRLYYFSWGPTRAGCTVERF
jgi:hypothetical protein